MFNIEIKVDDYLIENVCKEDVGFLYDWIKTQTFQRYMKLKIANYNEIYDSFLESYLSENEFFIKVMKKDKFVGIIKGRIEFVNPSEVWIMHFIIDKDYIGTNIESDIVVYLMEFFTKKFGMKDFYTLLDGENKNLIKFWEKNKFKVVRCNNSSNKPEMIILAKRQTNIYD